MDGSGLKLLYFSRSYTTHDRRFLGLLVNSGYEVHYLRLLGERLDNRALPEGVCCIPWVGDTRPLAKPSDFLVRYRALRRILSDTRPDVVLAGPIQTASFLVALTGFSPLVTMSWGSDILVDADRNMWMRETTRYALSHSAGVLGDCKAVREKIGKYSSLPDDRIVTFPWGIDLEDFTSRASASSLRQDLDWLNNPVFISTRTWESPYAIDVLVRALAVLLETHRDARLILLGDGSQDKKIYSLISQLNLTDYIHAPGRIDQGLLPDYYGMADVYVSSALSDGTSISLLEAMACRLPVIVTNSYGNLEWVVPGHNGWLVAPGDHRALALALAEALSNPARLEKMAQANVALAHSRANWNKNSLQLLKLLERVVESTSETKLTVDTAPIQSRMR